MAKEKNGLVLLFDANINRHYFLETATCFSCFL